MRLGGGPAPCAIAGSTALGTQSRSLPGKRDLPIAIACAAPSCVPSDTGDPAKRASGSSDLKPGTSDVDALPLRIDEDIVGVAVLLCVCSTANLQGVRPGPFERYGEVRMHKRSIECLMRFFDSETQRGAAPVLDDAACPPVLDSDSLGGEQAIAEVAGAVADRARTNARSSPRGNGRIAGRRRGAFARTCSGSRRTMARSSAAMSARRSAILRSNARISSASSAFVASRLAMTCGLSMRSSPAGMPVGAYPASMAWVWWLLLRNAGQLRYEVASASSCYPIPQRSVCCASIVMFARGSAIKLDADHITVT